MLNIRGQVVLEAKRDFEDRIMPLFTRRKQLEDDTAASKRAHDAMRGELDTARDEVRTARDALVRKDNQIRRANAEAALLNQKFEGAEKLRKGFEKELRRATKLIGEEKTRREEAEADINAFQVQVDQQMIEKDAEVSKYREWAATAKTQVRFKRIVS